MGEVVKLIINLPANTHIALKHTAIRLLAEVSPWINEHKSQVGKIRSYILEYDIDVGNTLRSGTVGAPQALHTEIHFLEQILIDLHENEWVLSRQSKGRHLFKVLGTTK